MYIVLVTVSDVCLCRCAMSCGEGPSPGAGGQLVSGEGGRGGGAHCPTAWRLVPVSGPERCLCHSEWLRVCVRVQSTLRGQQGQWTAS